MQGELTPEKKAELKSNVEKVLSAILSDKYECVVKLKFERGAENERKVQR